MHANESQEVSAAQKAVEGRQKGEGAGVWGRATQGENVRRRPVCAPRRWFKGERVG